MTSFDPTATSDVDFFFPAFCTEILLGDHAFWSSCFCFYPLSLGIGLLKTYKTQKEISPNKCSLKEN